MNWFLLFGVTFAFSSLSIIGLLFWAKDKASKFFRSGGIAIISSFIIGILVSSEIVMTSEIKAIVIGSIAILIFGFWDDCKNLNWKYQLFFQLLLALILIGFGFKIELISFSGRELFRLDHWNLEFFGRYFSIVGSFFIIFWSVGIINAVNWLDGSDGLLSIAGILSLVAVFFISLKPEVGQPALSIISLIGIGAFSGFFIFNFPSAKIEAGTSGSYFTGFLLASLAIMAGTKIATTMVVLILPVMDFVWVIIERIREKQSIFKRDNKRRHLHYKLLSLGFSPRQVLLGYGIFLSLALLISFFVINQTQKIFLLIGEFAMIFLFMLSLSKEISLKEVLAKIKKILLNPVWLVVLIVAFLVFFNFQRKQRDEIFFQPNVRISIAERIILKVQTRQTPEEVYQGLSDIEKLPFKNGMLFMYSRTSHSPHVMRGMKFDLDFIFLKNGKVVFIQEKVFKNFKGIIQSPTGCNQVLEINSGEVRKLGIKLGDEMKFLDND